ncbi:MAG TPA: hypothetical protein VN737_11835, partial [Bryobacteraceae bacterium]|nr:hypothetical protein [Bryobacteraceae bacterium]
MTKVTSRISRTSADSAADLHQRAFRLLLHHDPHQSSQIFLITTAERMYGWKCYSIFIRFIRALTHPAIDSQSIALKRGRKQAAAGKQKGP